MSTLSIRERIWEAIAAILAAVPGIGTVGRGYLDPLSIQSYPAACVSLGADRVVKMDLGDFIDRELTVYSALWIKSQSNVVVTLETFLPKVQRALAADYTLDGLVKDFAEVAAHEAMPMGEEQSDAGIIIEHIAIYRVNRLDPYSQS